MDFIGYVISLIVVGLIIGGLGRLLVPGPNPIGIWRTLAVGLAGAFLGALLAGLIGLGFIAILFEVAISAGLVYMMSRGGYRGIYSGGRRRLS